MLGLPKNTELKKQIAKATLYKECALDAVAREKFDNDIHKIFIENEISTRTTNIAKGQYISSFYVLHILLKEKDFNEKNIALIVKLIPQNMLFVLEYTNKIKLAVYYTHLHQTAWLEKGTKELELKGLDLDTVWENIILEIGEIKLEDGKNLEEQIIFDKEREKLQNQIQALEKKTRTEKQPKKKFALVKEIQRLEGLL